MTMKRILFAVMCALLVLVIIMTGIVINRAGKLLSGGDRLSGSTEGSSEESTGTSGESTENTTASQETESTGQETTETEHTHDYVLTEKIEASCENYGWNIYTCSLCEHVDMPLSERSDPLGHAYGHGVVVEATCTEGGCTRYTCERCGDVDEQNVTAALGHSWDEGTLIDSTCVDPAAMEFHCTAEGCTEMKRESVEGGAPAGGHSYGEWTGAADGTYQRVCTACGAVESSQDLSIRKEINNTVHDADGTAYVLYEIYVGTADSPSAFRYEIADYFLGEIQYTYDPAVGLKVTYDRGGEMVEQILPLCQDGNLVLKAEETQPEESQPEESQPAPQSEETKPEI